MTGAAFFKMREMFFEDNIDDAKYCGHLYGLGTSYIVNGNSFPEGNDETNSSAVTTSISTTSSSNS